VLIDALAARSALSRAKVLRPKLSSSSFSSSFPRDLRRVPDRSSPPSELRPELLPPDAGDDVAGVNEFLLDEECDCKPDSVVGDSLGDEVDDGRDLRVISDCVADKVVA
jgi:hypothetical protein